MGPTFKSMKFEGNAIRLSFDNTGSGLKTSDDEPPRFFAIAGEDKQFVWAEAKIDCQIEDKTASASVILSSNKVSQPASVRYG